MLRPKKVMVEIPKWFMILIYLNNVLLMSMVFSQAMEDGSGHFLRFNMILANGKHHHNYHQYGDKLFMMSTIVNGC